MSCSEYQKCNNACVKVTIKRYSGLSLEKLMRDAIPSYILERLPLELTNPHAPEALLKKVIWDRFECRSVFRLLDLDSSAEAEKRRVVDLSSVSHRDRIYINRLLKVIVELCDVRHRNLRFGLSMKLHKFMFPVLIQYYMTFQKHFGCTQQDFEAEEIYHGSGFLIADNFVITNKHVIEEAMSDETLEICILNETIGELPCVVVHCDPVNDLALLYCHGLDLKGHGICPFTLSEEALWPSLSVFSFGYPLTHTGRSALFVKGYVSGFKERYACEPFVVLNCVLNHGNSGGPVLRRIGDDIKVVGVVAQKHKKEILTLKEIKILEEERLILEEEDLSSEEECSILEEEQINGAAEERSILEESEEECSILEEEQINSAADSRDQFCRSLSLKLYDALNETHCQFGYANVVPGHLVVKFLSDPSVTSMMDFLKEMELCK